MSGEPESSRAPRLTATPRPFEEIDIEPGELDGISVRIWHAFSGDLAQAERAYNAGLMLGLGGPVTFQNAKGLRALAPKLRRDRLLLETDAPYLAPHPYRGQRNEPAYIPLIAQTLADLFDTTPAAVAEQTTTTAERCFRLRKA